MVKKSASHIAHFGKGGYLFAGAAVVGLGAWWMRRPQLLRVIAAMIVAGCVAGLAADAVRWSTGRARPNASVEPGWYGLRHDGEWIVARYEFSAFPSAHTATMTGFAAVLLFVSRRWGVWSLLPGLVMAWARMVNRAHHLSDVFVAMLFGVAAAYWTWQFLMPRLSLWLTNKVERKT